MCCQRGLAHDLDTVTDVSSACCPLLERVGLGVGGVSGPALLQGSDSLFESSEAVGEESDEPGGPSGDVVQLVQIDLK